jgi:hypothetical protein
MKLKHSLFALMFAAVLPLAAHADLPGKHPAYLHALTDLRDARWNLDHRPGDAAVSGQEDVAVTEIDKAIGEIKKAAIDDGKDVRDHTHEDANLDHAGRLHHALELLKKAEADVSSEEDNPENRGLQERVRKHIHEAIHAAEHALHDAEEHK